MYQYHPISSFKPVVAWQFRCFDVSLAPSMLSLEIGLQLCEACDILHPPIRPMFYFTCQHIYCNTAVIGYWCLPPSPYLFRQILSAIVVLASQWMGSWFSRIGSFQICRCFPSLYNGKTDTKMCWLLFRVHACPCWWFLNRTTANILLKQKQGKQTSTIPSLSAPSSPSQSVTGVRPAVQVKIQSELPAAHFHSDRKKGPGVNQLRAALKKRWFDVWTSRAV